MQGTMPCARRRGRPPGAVLRIFIWLGQSKAKQILGRTTEVVYVGIMGMTRAVWVGQERVWVGHGRGLPGQIAKTASEDHVRPGWTTSTRVQDCPWKSQSE